MQSFNFPPFRNSHWEREEERTRSERDVFISKQQQQKSLCVRAVESTVLTWIQSIGFDIDRRSQPGTWTHWQWVAGYYTWFHHCCAHCFIFFSASSMYGGFEHILDVQSPMDSSNLAEMKKKTAMKWYVSRWTDRRRIPFIFRWCCMGRWPNQEFFCEPNPIRCPFNETFEWLDPDWTCIRNNSISSFSEIKRLLWSHIRLMPPPTRLRGT